MTILDRTMVGLLTEDQFRRVFRDRYPKEDGYSHERIAEILGLSAGFVGMILDGTRKPSKSILDPLGMEKVIFYRLKLDPFTGKPWGKEPLLGSERRDVEPEGK